MFNAMVKNVFLMIMGVMVAMTLYFVFFGQGSWEGALWYGARAFEVPCAKHYYEYCYIPNVRANDYIDEALNGTAIYPDIRTTPSDLENDISLYQFHTTSDGSVKYWGTSWY